MGIIRYVALRPFLWSNKVLDGPIQPKGCKVGLNILPEGYNDRFDTDHCNLVLMIVEMC